MDYIRIARMLMLIPRTSSNGNPAERPLRKHSSAAGWLGSTKGGNGCARVASVTIGGDNSIGIARRRVSGIFIEEVLGFI